MLTSTKLNLPGKFLRKREGCAILSLSPTQLQGEINAGRFEPGTRLTANSNILVWPEGYVLGVQKARWDARGSPEDQARAEKCSERARNAVAHTRRMQKRWAR
jgi:hypothetical protein